MMETLRLVDPVSTICRELGINIIPKGTQYQHLWLCGTSTESQVDSVSLSLKLYFFFIRDKYFLLNNKEVQLIFLL